MRQRMTGVLLALCAMVAGCTSCGGGGNAPAVNPVVVPQFDHNRAFADLTRQCEFGPRAPGSQGHADCLAWLQQQLSTADSLLVQRFTASTEFGGPYDFANLIAVYGASKPGVPFLLLAHWDTRPVADEDPDPAKRNQPVLGANDGASGVAVLLEMARLMKQNPPPRPVIIALVDAEDSGTSTSTRPLSGFCIGSLHLANNWPASVPRPEEGVLLDLVGGDNLPNPACPPRFGGNDYLDFPIEVASLNANPVLIDRIWGIAERRGHTAFVRRTGRYVIDDHIPFIQVGIGVINIIDFPPPEWHTTYDTPEHCSPQSLRQVGDTLAHFLYGSTGAGQ